MRRRGPALDTLIQFIASCRTTPSASASASRVNAAICVPGLIDRMGRDIPQSSSDGPCKPQDGGVHIIKHRRRNLCLAAK